MRRWAARPCSKGSAPLTRSGPGNCTRRTKRRIIRAIEIYTLTGATITEHDRRSRELPGRYEAARIVLGYADRAAFTPA